jgi:hypothetical protein
MRKGSADQQADYPCHGHEHMFEIRIVVCVLEKGCGQSGFLTEQPGESTLGQWALTFPILREKKTIRMRRTLL